MATLKDTMTSICSAWSTKKPDSSPLEFSGYMWKDKITSWYSSQTHINGLFTFFSLPDLRGLPIREAVVWLVRRLPTGCRKVLQTGFSWWVMPHNQSIGWSRSEIRSWTYWPEEASDLSIIHLCPHLGQLDDSVLISSIKFCARWQSRQMPSVCQSSLAGHHAHPTLCILETPAHRSKHRAHCTRFGSPLNVSGTQTKLLWRWVMGSTGPHWICFEDNRGVFKRQHNG